jgi:hypothetical protein
MLRRIIFITVWAVAFVFSSAMVLLLPSMLLFSVIKSGGSEVSKLTLKIVGVCYLMVPAAAGAIGLCLGILGKLPGTGRVEEHGRTTTMLPIKPEANLSMPSGIQRGVADPDPSKTERSSLESTNAATTVQYQLTYPLAGWLLLCLAWPTRAADTFTSAYISEFLAENQVGFKDNDGDFSPWIELHNGGDSTVNLDGWFLTDNPTNRCQWRFPKVSLLPDRSLIVFASGKARTQDLAHLHTNFRLDPQGGYLALVNPATNAVSEFAPAYPRQSTDVSYGSIRGEPAMRVFFVDPTPGKPNTSQGQGFAPEVIFSCPSGTFTAPFILALSTRTPPAIVHYTLDGTLPNSHSLVYREPFLITNSVQVRARAYQEELAPGPPHSESFLLLHSNVTAFTSTLPVLVMETFGKDQPTSSRSASVHLSFFEPVHGVTSLTNPPTLATRGGFHQRGSSSRGMPQPGFAVQFLDEFNAEQHRPVLGLPADSDWVLYAPNGYDPGMIHNPFVHQLSRNLGHYSPRTRFLEVYLVTHAGPVTTTQYYGVYLLEEKIKVGKHRVNIDRLGADDLQAPQVTGGYLLKIDRLGPDEVGFNAAGVSMVYAEPKEPVMMLPQRAPQRQYLDNYFDDFDRALNGPKWKDPVQGYRAYVDVEAWINYHVLEVLSGNVDALNLSTYLHKPRLGKIAFGPHWDFDRALGSTDDRDRDPRQWNTGQFFNAAWWPRLFSDPDFWQRWVDRWQELRLTHFSLTNLFGLADRLGNEVREAHPREVQRWGLEPRGGSYESELSHMKKWLSNRVDFIDQELVQPPRFQREGGLIPNGSLLTLTGPTNAIVYYTLDGSDPRLSQGAISSNAMVYSNAIPILTNTSVTARARNPHQQQRGGPPTSTPWSSPVVAKFVTTSP